MKDNTTPKLILAVAVIAALGFAVWTGLSIDLAGPAGATPAAAFATPF